MILIYQSTGALFGQNGDCFSACLATVLGRRLSEVPNFYEGVPNGGTLSARTLKRFTDWLNTYNCGGYVEYGFTAPWPDILVEVSRQSPDALYLLTGRTGSYKTHVVICQGSKVLHDPGTEPGSCTLVEPCSDGYYRVGFLLYKPDARG